MEVWIAVGIGFINALLLVVVLRRSGSDNREEAQLQAQAQALALQQSMLNVQEKLERVERELRFEITESSRGGRQELTQTLASFQQSQVQQLSLMQTTISDTLNQQLQQLQKSNADKLDEMRRTVDEKLQTTLEKRLSESFKQVAERLEQVHNGLGQMQKLADGVGSLQRVLTNVKTRGMFGEVQLEALLEQVLTVEQYAKQVETKPRSNQRVDFAIRFPGRGGADGEPVWLPIDAKFPREDYERLLDAHDRADAVAAELSAKALETRIRTEAKSIAESYLAPPHTTDFAILFLPIEGLYAEVLRRPGLMDSLQRDYRVTLAGPTTLLAMLNSLHMGFRTLALEQQASEVWKVLGAVKTEFERYGDWVEKVREQVQKAADTLDRADTRSRQMRRALKNVEALPEAEAQALLPKFDEALDDSDAKV
ncbi:DNA recombination protein RmuC [Limnohabitans sp. TS-CS-82]|jgi:DNA recombination protein RmuC|uniref:DNA recombination protein RmuC n=1 Tax=Limnohabitans sp. TS-CS-82 TaxID=2094193 RepID=UPI000CF1E8CE|nr:DNA recombination protein RmuC [Limnohabitans sp. TS-CS-82]PQA84212.1 DNA recombination protein RmuC [Limnohabitans sp. TS-CS-82]